MSFEQSSLKFKQGDICLANYLDDKVKPVIIVDVGSTEKKYKVVPLSSLMEVKRSSVKNLLLNVELNGKPYNIVALCDRSMYLLETLLSIKIGNVDDNVISRINELISGELFCGTGNDDISKYYVRIDQNEQLLLKTVLHMDNGVSDLLSPSTMILNIFISIFISLLISSILIISNNSLKWILSITALSFIVVIIMMIYKKLYNKDSDIEGR